MTKDVRPDNDPIVQACIALSHAISLMMNVNTPVKHEGLSILENCDVQDAWKTAVTLVEEAFDVKVSTKLHRLLCHVADQ